MRNKARKQKNEMAMASALLSFVVLLILAGQFLFYLWSLISLPGRILSPEQWQQLNRARLRFERKRDRLLRHLYELLSIPLFGLILILSVAGPLYIHDSALSELLPELLELLPELLKKRFAVVLGLGGLIFANLFFFMNLYNGLLEICLSLHTSYGLIIRRFSHQGYFKHPAARRIGFFRILTASIIWCVSLACLYALIILPGPAQ